MLREGDGWLIHGEKEQKRNIAGQGDARKHYLSVAETRVSAARWNAQSIGNRGSEAANSSRSPVASYCASQYLKYHAIAMG
jgi:hypothetical protein